MVDFDKKYLKISEAAEICQTKEHILRYWEKQFEGLQPVKRNNRRYYQQKDIALILEIKRLLVDEKFTLEGAKKIIKQKDTAKPKVKIVAKSNLVLNKKDNHLIGLFGNQNINHNQKVVAPKNPTIKYSKPEIIKELKSILNDLKL